MSEVRPDLAAVAPQKPDVLLRLEAEIPVTVAEGADLAAWWSTNGDARDAIDCIEYLRAANQRHCNDERDLKAASGRLLELESETAAQRRRIADLEAEVTALRSHQQEGR